VPEELLGTAGRDGPRRERKWVAAREILRWARVWRVWRV